MGSDHLFVAMLCWWHINWILTAKYRCLWNTNAPFPNMTFDLDLWPTDLKINRDHLLIKDYLHVPTKFEASGAKPSWVICCTRLRETDIPTDRRTDMCNAICPSFFKGGHKYVPQMTCDTHMHAHPSLSLLSRGGGDFVNSKFATHFFFNLVEKSIKPLFIFNQQ